MSEPARENTPALDVAAVRADFPGLRQSVHGRPLVYLDNAATSQRPQVVLDAVRRMESELCANVHRGVHFLSAEATNVFEAVRGRVGRFIGANSEREVIFTRGTTESINLVAQTYGRQNVGAGDEVLISELEHHSNIVPWQMLCEEKGAQLRVIPINDRGELEMSALPDLLSERTKLVSVAHISNALGTINPVSEIIRAAHAVGAKVMIDGAQAAPHFTLDLAALDADFYAFSGHKMLAPTGVGVLYGKLDLLEAMPPWQGGGEMIDVVTLEKTTYNEAPFKFEAGTPHIEGVVGLGAAIDYLTEVGLGRIRAHEADLLEYATAQMSALPGFRGIGTAREKSSVLSFVFHQAHASDIGTILDQQGVAIRTGHHCAQPAMRHFGVEATARASFALYNDKSEVDALVRATEKALEMLG